MNEFDANNMSSFPEGYGEEPSEEIRPVGADRENLPYEDDSGEEDLGGLLSDWREKRQEKKAAKASAKATSPEEERDGFFSKLFGADATGLSGSGYRDLGPDAAGYTYRQYEDESIKILGGPANVGRTYAAGTEAARNVAKDYGTYSAYTTKVAKAAKKAKSKRIATAGAGIGTGITTIFSQLLGASAAEEEEPTVEVTDTGVNWTPYLVFGGILLVGGTVLYFVMRDKQDEDED